MMSHHKALTEAGELDAVQESRPGSSRRTRQSTASLCGDAVVVTKSDCNARSVRGCKGSVRVEGVPSGDSANFFTFVDGADSCGGNACPAVFSDCEGVAHCECCG